VLHVRTTTTHLIVHIVSRKSGASKNTMYVSSSRETIKVFNVAV